jgi:peptidoglycan-N-acetylglucosamine deacetylase
MDLQEGDEMATKRSGTIQIDLDGLWTNLNYYGHSSSIFPDPTFETSIPRFLDLFDKYGIKATFFLIGRDGEVSEKAALIKDLVKSGHEIANHTYSHVFGWRELSVAEKLKEIEKGEKVIERITGKKPVGFKAPGYDVDVETMKLLERKGYSYDSSIIATPFYPLIMKINQLVSGGVKRTHGPKWIWGIAPNSVYYPSFNKEWKKSKRTNGLIELPCSVMPGLRTPYHATFATKFGNGYFQLGHGLTKLMGNSLNYELHAADLADNVRDTRMPHLDEVSIEKRYGVVKNILKTISKDYEVITSRDFVARMKQ